jgi:FlaA1/EpsC-like NDP-sugar epimerase
MSMSAFILKPVVFKTLGIYRIDWKYIGLRELTKLVASSTLGSVAVVLVIIISIEIGLPAAFPRSLVTWDWLISTSLFIFFRRLAY